MDSLRFTRQFFFILALFSSLMAWQGIAHAEEEEMSAGAVATVNINSASAEEIATTLTGVGVKRAEAIIAYRDQHGPFAELADLQNVKGIGETLLEKNASRITF